MKTNIILLVLFLGSFVSISAQVGINTETPEAALDVNGTVRVTDLPKENTSDISITGITGGDRLNLSDLGENLVFVNDEVIISPISRIMGEIDLSLQNVDVATPDFISPGFTTRSIYTLKPDIDLDGENDLATFITFTNYNNFDYTIHGIEGGTEGRKVTFYFSDPDRFARFYKESNLCTPSSNRITSPNGNPFFGVSGTGFIELVYDADAGPDKKGRWLLLKFQN